MQCKLSLACNYHQTGMFQGHVTALDFTFDSGFYVAVISSPIKLNVTDSQLVFGSGKLELPVIGSRNWVGNWCWNQYLISSRDAKRLLRLLARCDYANLDQWTCSEKFEAWWERMQLSKKEKELNYE